MSEIAKDELMAKAQRYVRKRMYSCGGHREAWRGFWHKTFPFYLGWETPSLARMTAITIRMILLLGVALAPALARKVGQSIHPASDNVFDGLRIAVTHLDNLDIFLAVGIFILSAVAKVLQAWEKEKIQIAGDHNPYHDFFAAINNMPALVMPAQKERRAIPPQDDSIKFALKGLQLEVSRLIGDERQTQITDVTLLEFCGGAGEKMRVRVRTAPHEELNRAIDAYKLMAYYVAREGRWLVEHDFLNQDNPFPKIRLSKAGRHNVHYRSILFLPILKPVNKTIVIQKPDGSPGTRPETDDGCIGVICIHCTKPYRFWRWGDQSLDDHGFGNVALQRSLPYIALVLRLIEHSAERVSLEEYK
jgi:hypothetical protein